MCLIMRGGEGGIAGWQRWGVGFVIRVRGFSYMCLYSSGGGAAASSVASWFAEPVAFDC